MTRGGTWEVISRLTPHANTFRGVTRLRSTHEDRDWGLDVEQVNLREADDRLVAVLQSMPAAGWDALAEAFGHAEGASGGWSPPSTDAADPDVQPTPHLDAEARALVDALQLFVEGAGIEPGTVCTAVLDADLDELGEMSAAAALVTVVDVLHAGRADEGLLLSAFESGAMQTLADRVLTARPA